MGELERHTLSLALLAASAGLASPSQAADLVLEVGSPFTTIQVSLPVTSSVRVGPRIDLLDARALRAGVFGGWDWLQASPAVFGLDLSVSRAFGLSAVDTFDLDLVPRMSVELDGRSSISLRTGLIGYLGPERTQRGILLLAAVRLWTEISASWQMGFELGWIGDRFTHRPMGGISLAWRSEDGA